MDERRKILFTVVGVFICMACLLVGTGWLFGQKNQPSDESVPIQNGQAEAAQKTRGGAVKMPLYEEVPQSVHPLSPKNEATEIVLNFVYEPLLKKQADGSIKGVLADEWHVAEDGRRITIHLREGVQWHDGEPFTTDDVTFTFHQLATSDYKGKYRKTVRLITGVKDVQSGKAQSIEGIDVQKQKGIITFQLEQPLSHPAELLHIPIIPRHTDEKSKLAVTELVGTGPYRMAARSERNAIELEQYTRYWDEHRPYVERLSLRTMKIEEAISHFQQGKLDVLPQLDASLSESVLKESGLSPLQQLGDVFHYIAFNPQQKLWQNRELRTTVGSTLDKQQLVQHWLSGFGMPVDTPRGTQVVHKQELTETSKKALGQLQKQTLSLHYSSEWINRDALAERLQKQWEEADINVKLVKHKDTKGLMRAIQSGKADMFLMTDWVRPSPDTLLDWLTEDNLQHWTQLPVKEVRATLDKAAASEEKEREKKMREWDELFTLEAPMIPLVRPKMLYFVADDLNGVQADDFRPDGVDILHWHISNDEQIAKNSH